MRLPWPLLTVVPVLVAAALARPARADGLLLLQDGRILERERMDRVEGGVRVHFENGKVVIPDRLIQEAIVDGVPTYEPKNDKEREKLEKGLVPWQGRWVKASRLPDLVARHVAKRKAAVDEIRSHQLWRNRYYEKTKHFAFEYTVPPHVFAYYRDLLEAYYKAFAKDWKVKQSKKLGKLKVCFYTDRGDFHQISGAPRGALAYFKYGGALELDFFYDRLDPHLTEQVMYHEANHYLQKLMNPERLMPHFPGESIAEYYGASRYDAKTKKFETGLVLEGRLAEIKMKVLGNEMMSLETMLTTDRMYEHYNWGWSLAHYLMNDGRYRKKFERFVKDLAYGKDVKCVPHGNRLSTVPMSEVWAHFRRVFGLKSAADIADFETGWHTYVRDGLQYVSGRGLEQAARRAAVYDMPTKAKRLYREAIDAGTDNPTTYHRYGQMLASDGKHAEAVTFFEKAIELEPLEAGFYASLAAALFRSDEQAEGTRYAKLARELDPDSPWLDAELAFLSREVGNR